jgi:hypothetical protein
MEGVYIDAGPTVGLGRGVRNERDHYDANASWSP